MTCPNCSTPTDYVVFVAALIAERLLVAASATMLAIRLWEWWHRTRGSE